MLIFFWKGTQLAKIKIISVPKGAGTRAIQESWLGVVMQVATPEEIKKHPPLNRAQIVPMCEGYMVSRITAVEALKKAEKTAAAKFWDDSQWGRYIVFQRDNCRAF
ncbi:MAG: hypothetical protein A2605_00775 [Candidatus Zambryskibacteria bacterium RIFOXYD1_FULL_39_35]|nr:MAG: hypothetical protein A2605_00775 [Candidatus Zambryskibacteria bacterium RIFOXYD1_FULL_39_35]